MGGALLQAERDGMSLRGPRLRFQFRVRNNGDMDFNVRDAHLSEAFAVSELAARTFPLAAPPTLARVHIDAYIRENLTHEHFAAHIDHPERDVLVAAVGHELLGYVLAFFGADGAPAPTLGVTLDPAGLLSKCYAVPEMHGKGVAVSLLGAAEERARERGVVGLWLNVNGQNHRAQRFYAKHGWERVGDIDFVVGGSVHHDPVFQKRV